MKEMEESLGIEHNEKQHETGERVSILYDIVGDGNGCL
jgi:hypothetical protein